MEVGAEVDLSRDEDNVTSLAAGPRMGKSTLVYAGVNSSPADVAKGTNQHFRVFSIDQQPSAPKSKTGATDATERPKIAELSRSQLFSTRDADTYQRLLRISAPFDGVPQMGAVATGLAGDAQIALFEVSAAGAAGVKSKGRLALEKEAQDLDITQTGDGSYQLAFCADHELHIMNITKGNAEGSQCVYTVQDDVNGGPKPSFRSIRYLTPNFLVAAMNLPKRTGVVLHGFRLPSPGHGTARLAVSVRLPKPVTAATALAARNLSPVSSPSAKQEDTQFVIAVAGLDSSISLYTLEYQSIQGIDVIVKLEPFHTIKAAHPAQVTSLAFSIFQPPKSTTVHAQTVRLASTSVANTAVVHHIPLRKHFDRAPPAKPAGPPRTPRYVVAIKSKPPPMTAVLIALALIVAIMATVGQTWMELKGITPPVLGAHRFTPARWHGTLRSAAAPVPPEFLTGLPAEKRLQEGDRILLREDSDAAVAEPATVIGGDVDGDGEGGVTQTPAHDEAEHGPAMSWDELPPEQREA